MSRNEDRVAADAPKIAAYLDALPPDQRAALDDLRRVIGDEAPEAEEIFSYGMPMYRQHGLLVGTAAFTGHCSLVVMRPALLESMAADLEGYDVSKGTIWFLPAAPLPESLVRAVVRARLEENTSGTA